MSDERSPGGSAILRHTARREGWVPPEHVDEAAATAIDAHVERFVGASTFVFHEILSDLVHLDVHVVPPAGGRGWVLYTTGMSARPMTLPPGVDVSPYAELVLMLPVHWQVSDEAFRDPRWYWPVRLLKFLARVPSTFDTWLGHGHTIPNGDPAEPYDASTKLSCAMVVEPTSFGPDFAHVDVGDGRSIALLNLLVLHADETALKLEQGTDALLEAFRKAGADEVLRPERKSVVAKARWWWPW